MAAQRETSAKARIAVPVGDPNGIGPELALKAALDGGVRRRARLGIVADRAVLEAYAERLGCAEELAALVAGGEVGLEPVEALEGAPEPGALTAAAGRATLAYARHAIALALDGRADAVVAAPHNESAIARAGIPFDGYPGLVARETGTDPDKVFLMLVSGGLRIVHVTLHMGLKDALEAITVERVVEAARAGDRALRALGLERPRLAACGINPHAGEGGLFGDEDERIVRPAVAAARAEGIAIEGPLGADVLLAAGAHDGYLAMYHDQGHIPIKLLGRGRSVGLTIGAPVLFATVAHGSAHDIAGTNAADAGAFIGAIVRLAEEISSVPCP